MANGYQSSGGILGLLGAPETGRRLQTIGYEMDPKYGQEERRLGLLGRQQDLAEQTFQEEARKRKMLLEQDMRRQQALGGLSLALGVQPRGAVGDVGPQIPITPDHIGALQNQARFGALSAGVDPQDISALENVYRGPELPSDIRTFQYLQNLEPEQRQEYGQLIGPKGTTVTVGAGETEFAKQTAKNISDYSQKLNDQADIAAQQVNLLTQFGSLLDQGAQTGFGAETANQLRRLAAAAGLELGDNAGVNEAIQSLGNQFALQIRNPDSGMGLPGATSDRDIRFLLDSVANLGKTPQGNKIVIELGLANAQIKQQAADFANQLIEQNNGQPPADFRSQVRRFQTDLIKSAAQQYNPRIKAIIDGQAQGYTVRPDGVYVLD